MIIPAANAAEVMKVPEVASHLDIKPVPTLAEAVKIAFEWAS